MYKVQLDQFEGPLDLLLYFIRRDEIDIYDIPIAKITSEYLQIIEDMKSMNLSLAGEFILMASTLMRIKSKMLLPRPELDEEGEPIDPRIELVQQLIEYQRFKDVSSELSLRLHEQSFRHSRSDPQKVDSTDQVDVYLKKVSLFDLAEYFKQAMDNMPEHVVSTVHFRFGISEMGFALLTSDGRVFTMKNKNPVTPGDGFIFSSNISNKEYKFVSLTVLPGGEGSKQIFLAMTSNGRAFISEDLKLWVQKDAINFQ